MVALNEKFSHCGNLVSEGRVSPDVVGDSDFTKRSEEVHGGFVVICGVAGFCGLFDASPLRRNSAAPLNQSGPETQLYYVRNRTYSPGIGRWIQRDPIGYSGGINLFEYVGGRAVVEIDPSGLWSSYWNNPITNWIGSGLYGVGSGTISAFQNALAKLRALAEEALNAVAEPLFRKNCGCKQQREGKYIGINLGGDAGAFEYVGGLGIGGVQAILLCASRQVAFYLYGGGEVGVGTPVVAGGTAGLTGGYGLCSPSGYTGWFVGGQVQFWKLGGGLYKSWNGGVTNWNLGLSLGRGASLTTGGEGYGLLGVADVGGTASPCCPSR